MNILIDSNTYSKERFGASFEFMLSHGLIQLKEYLLSYKVAFVGEVFTPYGYFVSLPKNFNESNSSNVELVILILKEFKNLKKNGRLLLQNKTYEIGKEIESDYFYWRKLYSFFVDYITYEFYYPRKRNIRHSSSRLNGRLNPMLTEVNSERLGTGITYEVKNYEDNYFRNIFYSSLKFLEKKFASEIESRKILELEKYLRIKNIKFRLIELDANVFLSYSKKLLSNAVHETIVKTLVSYFLNEKITEKNRINVFYTKEFEYLYEFLLQKVLLHDTTSKNINWQDPNFKSLRPDIINESFIGDAKYFLIPDFTKTSVPSFEKELYAYNVANGNSQPNYVFIPTESNAYLKTLIHNSYKLHVVTINLHTVVDDYFNKKNTILNFIKSCSTDLYQKVI
ncbi:MAG: hypothetical protein EOO51_01440 [Flavobacterium sp.]|nr:MAG: hypothetical protein EOO51_01440 [Flavobacterium sp.]